MSDDKCTHEWHAFPEGPRRAEMPSQPGRVPLYADVNLYYRNCGAMK